MLLKKLYALQIALNDDRICSRRSTTSELRQTKTGLVSFKMTSILLYETKVTGVKKI